MDKNSRIKIVAKNYYNIDAIELEKNILASVRSAYERGFQRGVEKESLVNKKWHVFYFNKMYSYLEADNYPRQGESFLFYRKEYGDMFTQTWDQAAFELENKTMEGQVISYGDAWMNSPPVPKTANI